MNFQNNNQLSTVHCKIVYKCSKQPYTGWAKKNGTQTTLNNFFAIWPLTLQFTHITLQHVQFMYLKGIFHTQ